MIKVQRDYFYTVRHSIMLILFLGLAYSNNLYGQKKNNSNNELGRISFPEKENPLDNYIYDADKDVYVYQQTEGDYPLSTPLVLTPKEYQRLQLKHEMNTYFKNKVSVISQKKGGQQEAQKDLLPELYVNSKFFQSIFGGNEIDVLPQGSIGVDMGVRYQKTDNPALSPRNRTNLGFDFDQRINLSFLGKIGDRLEITANYDTESTFDFQNLVKLEFNPPRFNQPEDYLPSSVFQSTDESRGGGGSQLLNNVGNRVENISNRIEDKTLAVTEKVLAVENKAWEYQNRVNDFLNAPASEDAILQNIDIGNISMPLNSTLISGAQSLVGVKAEVKFGRTNITGVIAEQRSQSQSVVTQGGGTLQEFSLFALDYEADKHYFLAHYFRDNYDTFLKNYPFINSPIQITRIEVWVTNRQSQTNNIRNIIALQDLGESNPENTKLNESSPLFFNTPISRGIPSNKANKLDPTTTGADTFVTQAIRDIATVSNGFGVLSSNVREGFDYAILESARKLNPNEYTLQPQLGYISLNQRLSNDEILGVAFQFTYNGSVYQVGEFANGGVDGTSRLSTSTTSQQTQVVASNNLVVKMLKSSVTNVTQPVWDLMMKNIYNTGAFQLEEEDFKLNILYADPSPINYISAVDPAIWPAALKNQALLRTLSLDQLNLYKDPEPEGDGFFDFIPGITVNPQFGRIIFPTVEPFGETLFKILDDSNSSQEQYENQATYNANQSKYVFRDMYALTQAGALETSEQNKYQIKGRYKSAGGDGIPIGAFNVPRGSVKVTVGGRVLREGIDYTVNYQIGRVKILDPALQASNTPIQVSVENNAFFGQQGKRFSGIDVVHKFNNNFVLGGTLINLSENPLTQKANYGTEPVNNTMVGLNINLSTEVPFLTRLVNKLPTINTVAPSRLSFRGEVASFIAGNPQNTQLEGEANVYLDDFEGAQTNIDVKGFLAWRLSSVPSTGVKGSEIEKDNLESGFNRAKLAWYSIDPIFYNSEFRPAGITNEDISLNTTRRIFIEEIFPEQDLVQGQPTFQPTLDLAYFPEERGPYNNNREDVFKSSPDQNWAGVMRPISSTNFEQSNVEFIEFWILDTFSELETSDENLGSLVFHLGNISEDILKDGRKQYENGLPGTSPAPVNQTNWGKTPSSQSLLYAFNTVETDRLLQDVGLDGLSDSEEQAFYPNGPSDDPAGDNYSYFVQETGGIINRYKKYNGTEGNSPIAFSDTNRGNTTKPDTEDINQDQTMNTIDSYFEYRIPISKNMNVGNHPFVTDIRNTTVNLPNGDELNSRWIQFKIPIDKRYYEGTSFNSYFDKINGIEDLRSIRFMRMVLNEFKSPVVFRFATLDLVRGDWRRYNQSLSDNAVANADITVDISTVNILENENRVPVNYVLPPQIQREQVNNNNTIIRQNEQSLSFRVCNLQPMDSKGIYKNVSIDLRQYKQLKMFLHAESIQGQNPLPGEGAQEEYDKRLVAFVRIGTDYKDNYYQIEVPLKPTAYTEGVSNKLSAEEVWQPNSNSIDIPIDFLSKLKAAVIGKISQNAVYYDEELNIIDEFAPISSLPGEKKYKFSIRGNPSLGEIRTMMIGVKNPSRTMGDILCGEVWFNEFRISGIDNKGGWATTGALDVNLADFATVRASGRISTIGFGSLEQSPNQRSREDMYQFDVTTSLNAGQLLPNNWGVQIPLNYNIGVTTITPEYDPFYQDIRLKDRLAVAKTQASRDTINDQAITRTERKSISLIGVRKTGGAAKPHFYNIQNLDFSYTYNELSHRDYEIQSQSNKTVSLAANYNYGFKPIEINPFKKIQFISRKKYLKWLREVNFNLMPNNVAISSNINRLFNRQRFREVYTEGVEASKQLALPDLQQRNFLFDWNYSISHNLSRSLRLNFTSSRNNIVRNYYQTNDDGTISIDKTKGIWDDLWNIGDPNRHTQTLTLNYQLPFKYIPFLGFINANYSYTGDFSWQRGSERLGGVEDLDGNKLGIVNNIENANTQVFSGHISMSRIYNLLGIKRRKEDPKTKATFVSSTSVNKKIKLNLSFIADVLEVIKRIQFNYTENNGKVLPGYLPTLGSFGTMNPTLGFTLGSQADVRYEVARKGWLTDFPNFNQQFTQINNSQFKLTGQLNFGKGILVDITADRSFSRNLSENFSIKDGEYTALNPNSFGNFGISTLLIGTAFSGSSGVNNSNFEKFRANRLAVAQRLATAEGVSITDVDADGFPKGYGRTNQSVIIPAFLAAYTATSPNQVSLSPIRNTPLPNWNIRYTGLTNNKYVKKIFNRFSITHAYRSSFTINNFQTNLDYNSEFPKKLDSGGNIVNPVLYSNLNLVEQFNPLFKVDMELKNSFSFLLELKTDRSLSLSLDNNLLTESRGQQYVVGAAYRLKDLGFKTRIAGKRTTLSGDLNLKADVSYRNNITVLRNLEDDNNQVTAGQSIWSIMITADYMLSKNLTSQFFYDHSFSEFAISTAFPQTSIRSGISLRYNFGN